MPDLNSVVRANFDHGFFQIDCRHQLLLQRNVPYPCCQCQMSKSNFVPYQPMLCWLSATYLQKGQWGLPCKVQKKVFHYPQNSEWDLHGRRSEATEKDGEKALDWLFHAGKVFFMQLIQILIHESNMQITKKKQIIDPRLCYLIAPSLCRRFPRGGCLLCTVEDWKLLRPEKCITGQLKEAGNSNVKCCLTRCV